MRSTDEDSSAAARTPHPGGVNPSRLDHHPRRMMLRHWPPGAGAGQRVPQSRVLHRESKPDGRMSRENRRHYRRTRGHATWRLCRQLSRERCGRYGVEDRGFSLRRGAGDGGRPSCRRRSQTTAVMALWVIIGSLRRRARHHLRLPDRPPHNQLAVPVPSLTDIPAVAEIAERTVADGSRPTNSPPYSTTTGPCVRQPWKAACERDYGWLAAVLAEHLAGSDATRER